MSAVLAPEVPALAPDQVFTPGIRTDLAHADYLAIDAFSSSASKRILQSPMHYQWDRDNPSEATPAQLLGTALHMAILEPDRFERALLIKPEDAPRRPTVAQLNAAKKSPAAIESIGFWSRWEVESAGRLVLTDEQAAVVQGMVDSVKRHPLHDELLCAGQAEVSLQWRDARLGIACKARFDYLREDGIALDLKSCVDASPEAFARAAASFKYHFQQAHYNNGHEHLIGQSLQAFLFIAVENTAPFACAVYTLPANAIHFALDRIDTAMRLYAEACATGRWRGYEESIQSVVLPRWATTLQLPTY